MKIIDRYLTIQFLNPFVYCLFLFLFLYIVLDLFGHLDEILKARTSFGTLFQYYLSFVPIIFVQTTPLAALLATAYSIGNLKKNSEITALRASGLSVLRIVAPFLVSGFAVSLRILVINDQVVPQATLVSREIKESRIELKSPLESQGILKNVTLYGGGNRMFYIKTFDTHKALLRGIIILVHDARNVVREKILAKSGRWLNDEWVFYDTVTYRLGTKGQVLGDPYRQDQTILAIPESPEDFTKSHRDPDLMSFRELYNYIGKLRSGGYRPTRELIALHSKIALPFITFVAVLIGIPAVLRTSNRGGGTWIGICISISMGLMVYVIMAISLALGRAHVLPPVFSAWLTNVLFSVLGGFFLTRS